jgi:hypothetical protein
MTTITYVNQAKFRIMAMDATELDMTFEHYQSLDYRSVKDDIYCEMLAIEIDNRENDYLYNEEDYV